MNEEGGKAVSTAPKRNRANDRKSFCILYLSLMASASIAVAVQAMDERRDSLTAVIHDMLLGLLYATSACVMFGATVYFTVKHEETFEAARRISGSVSFIVKYSRCGEHVNLYLRLGLSLFATMSIGQSVIRLHEMQMQPPMHWPEVFKSTFEIGFFATQTLFILINHRIVILHNNEIFGASFIHVLSTNLCMWADVMVDKVSTTLHLSQRQGEPSGSSVSFYLLPAVSEYCLLSAALIYEITVRIGQPSYIELEEEEEEEEEENAKIVNSCHGREGRGSLAEERSGGDRGTDRGSSSKSSCSISDPEMDTQISRNQVKGSMAGRSLPCLIAKNVRKVKTQVEHCSTNIKSGYWAPLLIVLTISALTVTTGLTPKTVHITPWKCAVLFTEEMFLNCMGIFVTLASCFKLRRLKFTIAPHQSVIDEFVLYITFFFASNYLIACVALASYFSRVTTDPIHKNLLMGRLALNMLELVEVILQTYLIQDCFRRCSEEDLQQRIKPGRQMIAVLLGINLASWVMKSFQLKEADILYNITVHDEIAYGWVLVAITIPVFLFYRYHCTVCLSQAFAMLYEDETRRFEALWRQNPIYLSNLLSHTNLAMCEEKDMHLHAHENRLSERMSNRQLNEMFYCKFSTQSFQQIEYMLPRRASFFHSGAPSTSTTNMHDTDIFLASHQAAPLVHKLSTIHCAQKKLSVSSFKRINVTGPKLSIKGTVGGAHPSRCLVESESYEGPNYFLSYINSTSNTAPPIRNECATQTTSVPLSYDQLYSTSAHDQQLQLSRPSTLRTLGSNASQTNRCNSIKSSHTPEAEGMQRRQTLVNLETAKYRFLAAEMAHKRVLDRSVDGAGGSEKKQTKSKRKRSKRGKPPTMKKGPRKSCCSSGSASSPPSSPKIPEPHTHQTQLPDQEFDPSRLTPVLITRNMVNTADGGGQLSAVPEEGAYDFSVTPSPTFGVPFTPPTGGGRVDKNNSPDTFRWMKQVRDEQITKVVDSPEATCPVIQPPPRCDGLRLRKSVEANENDLNHLHLPANLTN